MRKLSPAYVVTSLVIAVAGTAHAQSAARPAGLTAATSGAKITGAPQVSTSGTSGAANQTSTVTNGNNGNITSTTVTNADGSTTTTGSNGLTSTSPAGASTSASGTTSSSNGRNGPNTNGTRSGFNTDSSAANAPIGSTSATSATGASSANGTTTPENNGLLGSAVLAPGVVNPTVTNGAMGGAVGGAGDGERAFDDKGNPLDQGANGNASVQPQNNGYAGASVAADSARASHSYDRAVQQVQQDRKKIGRNGQLLQSIAPRTNADRSNEMPDDGPSPTLSGTGSALAR